MSSTLSFPPLPTRPALSPSSSASASDGSSSRKSSDAESTNPPDSNPGGDRSDHKEPVTDERRLFSTSKYLLPVYVFDEREIELSGLPGYERKGEEARTPLCGFWKTGAFRAR